MSKFATKTNKLACPNLEMHEASSLSPRNILSAIGSRLMNLSQESTESKKTTVIHVADKSPGSREKQKKDEKPIEKPLEKPMERSQEGLGKAGKKYLLSFRVKELRQKHERHIDRDMRRFKAKYNISMGNIVREWMSLIYCILILRINLIQFVLKNLPDGKESDIHLHRQILLESKTIFSMIREAQRSSQEKFLFLWLQLEKLIFNRKLLKNGLQVLQMKDPSLRDWKAADEKLTLLQNDFNKHLEEYKEAQESKNNLENATKDNLLQLEKLIYAKDTEYNLMVEKITEMKKREVQMRGRILINMKSYKDLKAKKQKLVNVEEKMEKLKTEQNIISGEYTAKIQLLKDEIEESDKLIKAEKEEKKKIKASLEGFGDYSEK